MQNVKNVKIFKTDAVKFLSETPEKFDKILLDVPCSAEGRFDAKNEKSFGFWSEEKIRQNADLQKKLLALAWQKLQK